MILVIEIILALFFSYQHAQKLFVQFLHFVYNLSFSFSRKIKSVLNFGIEKERGLQFRRSFKSKKMMNKPHLKQSTTIPIGEENQGSYARFNFESRGSNPCCCCWWSLFFYIFGIFAFIYVMITGIAWVVHGISTTGLQSDLPNFNEAVTKCPRFFSPSATFLEEQLELNKTVEFTQKCYDEGGCFDYNCSAWIIRENYDAFRDFHMEANGWFTQCLFAYDFNDKEYKFGVFGLDNFGEAKLQFGIPVLGTAIPYDADEDIAYYEKYNCFSIPIDYLKKNFIDEDLKLRYSIHLYEKEDEAGKD